MVRIINSDDLINCKRDIYTKFNMNIRIKSVLTSGIIFLALITSSCKKEDPFIDPAKTPEERLIGNWMLTEFESDFFGPMINGFPFLQPCFTDNILMFFADNTFIMDEGETKCQEHNDQIYEEGDWILLDNASKIKYGIYEVEILEFTDTKLKSTYKEWVEAQNKTVTFIQTFTKIEE